MTFRDLSQPGFERVVAITDPATGLEAYLALHDCTLGPALGGIRRWVYPTRDAALRDVLRLAEAMTYKAAMADLALGGGKLVVALPSGGAVTEGQLEAVGEAIEALDGRYIATEDVGTSPQDLQIIARRTRHLTGLPRAAGGGGDPSPFTALGVLEGMKACVEVADGVPTLAGRTIHVHGVGRVGSALADLLVREGARVAVADVDPGRAAAVRERLSVTVLSGEEALTGRCDVLAPCALGGILNAETIPRLRCRIVAGGANNQLATPADGDALARAGVVYAPDFVINAGGLINCATELDPGGYREERARDRTHRIRERVRTVLTVARERGVSPARAALAMAQERIRQVRERV